MILVLVFYSIHQDRNIVKDIYATTKNRVLGKRRQCVHNYTECNSSFGLLLRKHHCRACGRIFCYQCTNYQIKLPREFETFPSIPEQNISNVVKNWVTGNKETLDRVCQKCYLKYNKMKHIYCFVRILSHGYLTLPDWGALGLVNHDWKSASIYVFSNFSKNAI